MKLIPASVFATALLLAGCSSKSFTNVAVTKPIHVNMNNVEVSYAADKAQRELYQPAIEAALYERGIRTDEVSSHNIVIAPRFIGDYMVYNDMNRPIETIKPLSETELTAKIEYERNAAQAMSESLYYRFSNAADFSSVQQWLGNYAISAASAALFAYAIDGAFDADGWQMITDIYIDGERTRIFAHTFDNSLEPKEAVAELMKRTAEQIADLVAPHEGGKV